MKDEKPDLPNEAVAALTHGKKIDAIKIVRLAQGVDLKEAKERVERFIEHSPNVKNRMAAASAESTHSGLVWLALIGAMAAFAYYFYTGGY